MERNKMINELKNFLNEVKWEYDEKILDESSKLQLEKLMEDIGLIDNSKTIRIKYFGDTEHIGKINKGDWIDLRSSGTVELKAGEFKLIPLGIGMILPDGYEANIVPRSSTFKNYGILQTNSFAVIDNSYSGDNDMWMLPVYATRDTVINKNDRICQFRINKKQPTLKFDIVEHLNENDRGGFGSTGRK